jgi:hypothetical protein
MLDKILKSRLEQVKEFKEDALTRIELLQVRISELTDEENLINSLLNLYHVYNPDPIAITDKATDDIIKGTPKKTKFTISSELADALSKLEDHKQKKLENQVKKEVEKKLRVELEPEIKEQMKNELIDVISQEQNIISTVNKILKQDDLKQSNQRIQKKQSITEELLNPNGKVNFTKLYKIIEEFIINNGNEYVTLNEITEYLTNEYPYLSKVWMTIKKGASNALLRMKNLEVQKLKSGRKKLYRLKDRKDGL